MTELDRWVFTGPVSEVDPLVYVEPLSTLGGSASRAPQPARDPVTAPVPARWSAADSAVIEQAKGVLMLLTGSPDQVAFELLTHISSHTHRKVRDIASELVSSATGRCRLPDDVRAILRDACPPSSPMH
jgi:hypothetical protein